MNFYNFKNPNHVLRYMKVDLNSIPLSRTICSIGVFAIILLCVSCSSNMIEERDDYGNLTATYAMKDSIKHGKYTAFHPDGSVFEESTYVDGEVHGVRIMYYEGNKKTKVLETYEHGEMEGLFEEYHLNGQVAFSGIFTDGAMEGIFKKYSETGQIIEEVTFVDSDENGPFKEYHLNGQLAAEGGYINGDNEHGPLKLYDENGELIKEMNCDRGICKTIWSKEDSTN